MEKEIRSCSCKKGVHGAQWAEINIDEALWHIPAERMKKKKAHTVPLSAQVLRLLERMHPISGHTAYVFVGDRNNNSSANSQTTNMALKRMGFKNMLVSHGMRALASTILNEQGFDADVIESALAHVDKNQVRRSYNRAEYLTRRRSMMDWWSAHIEESAQGNMSLASTGVKEKLDAHKRSLN